MAEDRRKKKTNRIWGLFSSVKLTIVLLIILAIVSILGTIIPQREGTVEFAGGLSPEMFRLFSFLNLFDMYHSAWFRLLIFGVALNLIICSIDRFPGTWKRFQARPRANRSKPFEHLPPQLSFTAKGELRGTADTVDKFLRTRYKNINKEVDSDKNSFYGEKGRYSHFGVYLVHSSVLFILIGALVGSFFGFEAYVNIMEGDRVDKVTLKKEMTSLALGFEVQCNKFKVDFYDNGAPKEYRSELSFIVNGNEVEKRSLLVNHPVQFRGITFYQASYGTVPGKKVRLKISRHADDPEITHLTTELGKELPLPGNEGRFRIIDIKGNFMRMGPAALVSVQPDKGKEIRFWMFRNETMIRKQIPGFMEKFQKLNPSAFSPYTFFLEEAENRYYTGLQANKDPGVPIVWTGCFLMVVGFFVTFFTSHRRIWLRISNEKGRLMISVAGTADKNPVGLQRELEHLANNLKTLLANGE